jgi:hypothetical protein
MKKIIFNFIVTALFSAVSYANTPTLENEIDIKSENQTLTIVNNQKEESTVCTITCSKTIDGVTYTTSSVGWLTSCNKAGNDCLIKLGKLTTNLEP